jgi:hypothetical protein
MAASKGVTLERAARLCRLLHLLAATPQARAALARRLRLDVRSFYRDLGLLRSQGISLTLANGRYRLNGPLEEAIDRLPFPDPHFTLGEAMRLSEGRTSLHRKLRKQVNLIIRPA